MALEIARVVGAFVVALKYVLARVRSERKVISRYIPVRADDCNARRCSALITSGMTSAAMQEAAETETALSACIAGLDLNTRKWSSSTMKRAQEINWCYRVRTEEKCLGLRTGGEEEECGEK